MQNGPIVIDSLSAFIKRNYPLRPDAPTRQATPEELAAIKEYLTPAQRKNTPNSCDTSLQTPCHLAVIHNQPQILELFTLEANGSLNNHDNSGKKPGEYATNHDMARVVMALQKEVARRNAYGKINRGGKDLGYLLERNKHPDEVLIGMIRNFLVIRKEEVYALYYADSNLAHIAVWSHVSEKVLTYLAIGCTNNGRFIDFNAENSYGLRPIDYAPESKKAIIRNLIAEQSSLLIKDSNKATHHEMFHTNLAPPPPVEESAELTLIARMVDKLNLGPQTIASRSQKKPAGLVSMRLGAVSPRAQLPQSAAAAAVAAAAPISPSLSAELPIAASISREKAPLLATSPDSSPPRVNSPQEVVSPRILRLEPLGERARKPVDKADLSQAKGRSQEQVATSPRERGFSLLGTLKAAATLSLPFSERPKSVLLTENVLPPLLPVQQFPEDHPHLDANLPTYQLIDKDNVRAFIAKKRDPNGKSGSINHPYFLQAFISSAQNIFIWLVENGLYLDKDHAWLKILEYTKEGPTSHRISFLNTVIKTLKAKVNVTQTNEARLALFAANDQFEQLLVEKGLKNLTHLPPKPNFGENSLEGFLYDLCSGFNFETKEFKFNAEVMQKVIYGCLTGFSPEEILDTLCVLDRFLNPTQKLFAYYIVKTLLTFDNIYNCYQHDNFFEKNLNTFLKLMAKHGFAPLNAKLLEILALRKKAATPILTAINLLQAVVARCKVEKTPFTEDPLLFANELRAISLHFYQTVSLHEFIKLRFSKLKKEKLSPNVLNQITITNKLSYYLIKNVLEKPNQTERLKYIVFLINTLHELIHGEIKDYNAAMCIAGALGDRFMNLYMRQLIDFDRDAAEKWNVYSELFMPMNNFGKLRKAMTTGIPFLGTFLQDLTFTGEKQNLAEKCITLASIFSSFCAFQEKLFDIDLRVKTDLLYTIEQMAPRDDDVLEMLAIKASPPPIRFDLDLSLPKLVHMLNAFADQKLPLSVRVRIDEKWSELTAETALPHLMKYLESNLNCNNSQTATHIAEIFTVLKRMPSFNEKIDAIQADFMSRHPDLIITDLPTPLLMSPRQRGATSATLLLPTGKDLLDKGKSPKPL